MDIYFQKNPERSSSPFGQIVMEPDGVDGLTSILEKVTEFTLTLRRTVNPEKEIVTIDVDSVDQASVVMNHLHETLSEGDTSAP